jgi:hypothetical protein
MSRCSSVSVVSDYGLDDWEIEVRSPAQTKDWLALRPTQPRI